MVPRGPYFRRGVARLPVSVSRFGPASRLAKIPPICPGFRGSMEKKRESVSTRSEEIDDRLISIRPIVVSTGTLAEERGGAGAAAGVFEAAVRARRRGATAAIALGPPVGRAA